MKKRAGRKTQKPPPARAGRRSKAAGAGGRSSGGAPGLLQYKVVELSTVDEGSLELAVNEWVRRGWALDGIQFAMRESSKRPAMAFVFFTRQGTPADPDVAGARDKLVRLAEGPSPERSAWSARERLAEMASGGDEPAPGPEGDAPARPAGWWK